MIDREHVRMKSAPSGDPRGTQPEDKGDQHQKQDSAGAAGHRFILSRRRVSQLGTRVNDILETRQTPSDEASTENSSVSGGVRNQAQDTNASVSGGDTVTDGDTSGWEAGGTELGPSIRREKAHKQHGG